MSWGCREIEGSRSYSDDSGVIRGMRKFHVWSLDETLDHPLLVIDRFGQTGTHTDGTDTLPDYGDYFLIDGDLIAVSPKINLVDSTAWLWEVEWNYIVSQYGVGQPNDVGYVLVTISSRGGFKNAWRANPSYPPLVNGVGGVLTGNIVECGGTVVDLAGEPMSVPSSTADISVGVTVDAIDPLSILDAAKNSRNSVPILGAAAGRLVFADYTLLQLNESRYRMTYHFVSDSDYHLLQYPARDALGEVIISNSGISYPNSGATVYNYAASVLWRQPFPNLTNFYNLSPWFSGRI